MPDEKNGYLLHQLRVVREWTARGPAVVGGGGPLGTGLVHDVDDGVWSGGVPGSGVGKVAPSRVREGRPAPLGGSPRGTGPGRRIDPQALGQLGLLHGQVGQAVQLGLLGGSCVAAVLRLPGAVCLRDGHFGVGAVDLNLTVA